MDDVQPVGWLMGSLALVTLAYYRCGSKLPKALSRWFVAPLFIACGWIGYKVTGSTSWVTIAALLNSMYALAIVSARVHVWWTGPRKEVSRTS